RPHSFLFADLVGFAALAELHGDEAAADVATRLAAEAARLAEVHGARLVKSLGDAVMVHSRCPVQAVRLGLRLHAALAAVPGFPPMHAGVHTGGAIERGGDWFGATVNLAARVA